MFIFIHFFSVKLYNIPVKKMFNTYMVLLLFEICGMESASDLHHIIIPATDAIIQSFSAIKFRKSWQ